MASQKLPKRLASLIHNLEDIVRPSGDFNLQEYVEGLKSSDLQVACKRLALLYSLFLDICAETDLPNVLNKIINSVKESFNIERAFLALRSGSGLSIMARYNIDLSKDVNTWPLSTTMIRRVLQEGICIRTTDAKSDKDYANVPSVDAYNIRSVMCCPIGSLPEPIGLIYVDNREKVKAFTWDDLLFLDLLSHYASLAIIYTKERLRLTEEKEQANARFFAFCKDMIDENDLIGTSAKMVSLYARAMKAAASDVAVLLQGETGTGKEVMAKLIHAHSFRNDKPFVIVNVRALSGTLLESELFGHEKGAFTGADKQRIGRFEQADGGTIFLDEVQDIPYEVQSKLLRFIEEHSFERVGCNKTIKANVRIISASNKGLEECIKQGVFREDLFYRLNIVTLNIPPLRERTEDIRPLANYFLLKINSAKTFSDEALSYMENYDWPGNIRELKNCIEGIDVIADASIVNKKDLPERIRTGLNLDRGTIGIEPLSVIVKRVEKEHIRKALELTNGNCEEAIKILKMARSVFFNRKKLYDL